MFGDPLSLQSGFAPGETSGIPNATFDISYPGFSAVKAQQSYSACMIGGGDQSLCGMNAAQAGMPDGVTITPVNKNLSAMDRIKMGALSILGASTGQYGAAAGSASLAATGSNDKLFNLSINRLAVLIIGIVFIGASLFLMKSAPIVTIASNALKSE